MEMDVSFRTFFPGFRFMGMKLNKMTSSSHDVEQRDVGA